jgi:hypothetical protein
MADIAITTYTNKIYKQGASTVVPGFIEGDPGSPVNPPGSGVASEFVPYVGAGENVDLGEFGLSGGFLKLDTTPTNTPTDQGTFYWDEDDNTVDIVLNGYIMKIGEDLFYPVKNQTGSSIPKGTNVRFAGTVGNSGRLLITPYLADGTYATSRYMGVTAETIDDGEDGKVLWFGRIRGINTNTYNEGDILYASTTVAGGFQTTLPVAPNNIVEVAAVVTKSSNQGVIFVRPTFGANINKNESVKITSPTTGDLLQLQSNLLWENKSLSSIIGTAYVPSTRTLTINGTALDLSANRSWTVGDVRTDSTYSNPSWITGLAWSKITSTPTTLSGYGITNAVPNTRTITINGTSFDLSANRSWNVGTVTSVSALTIGTSGTDITSSVANGTTTPVITINIPTASASNRGALSSTDWSTFNNKQNSITLTTTGSSGAATLIGATLNIPTYTLTGLGGVGGSGTTNYLPKFTGGTTIGNSQIIDNGTNILIGTSSDNGAKLQVNGGATFVGNIILNSSASRTIGLGTGSGDAYLTFASDDSIVLNVASGKNLNIQRATASFIDFDGAGIRTHVGGVQTTAPVGTTADYWKLGRALTSGTSTPDRWIRVQIGALYYDLLAVYIGTDPS